MTRNRYTDKAVEATQSVRDNKRIKATKIKVLGCAIILSPSALITIVCSTGELSFLIAVLVLVTTLNVLVGIKLIQFGDTIEK